jgi:hypothetical protein
VDVKNAKKVLVNGKDAESKMIESGFIILTGKENTVRIY